MAIPTDTHAGHDIIVIGASLGGIDALANVCARLDEELAAAVLVVVVSEVASEADAACGLERLSSAGAKLPLQLARDGSPLQRGRIYLAPPDRHLIVERDRLLTVRGPKENRQRPAVDPLFRSAAAAHGARVIGVVLTGLAHGGAHGLAAIKDRGGIAVVQHPEDARYPDMPRNALAHVVVDHIATLDQLPSLLSRLVATPSGPERDAPPPRPLAANEASGLMCPACGGALWEEGPDGPGHLRCHVGHAYALESLAQVQRDEVEHALWSAVRALADHATLSERIARRAADRGDEHLRERHAARAHESLGHAEVLRRLLER